MCFPSVLRDIQKLRFLKIVPHTSYLWEIENEELEVLDMSSKFEISFTFFVCLISGHLLCRSRSPNFDFLLDILNRQGSNQAMPWLADLVESSEGSFDVLPVQCLCEFLLNSTSTLLESANETETENKDQKTKKRKQKQLLLHLQRLLQHPVTEKQHSSCIETLDYFMRRLSSQQTHQRMQALKGLKLVLSPIGMYNLNGFLLTYSV